MHVNKYGSKGRTSLQCNHVLLSIRDSSEFVWGMSCVYACVLGNLIGKKL